MQQNIKITTGYQHSKIIFQNFAQVNNLRFYETSLNDFTFVTKNGCFFTIRYRGENCFEGWDFFEEIFEISSENLCVRLQNDLSNLVYIYTYDKNYFYIFKMVCNKQEILSSIQNSVNYAEYFAVRALDNSINKFVDRKGKDIRMPDPIFIPDFIHNLNIYEESTKPREEYLTYANVFNSRTYYTNIDKVDYIISLVTNYCLTKIRIDLDISDQKGAGKGYQKIIDIMPNYTKNDLKQIIQDFVIEHKSKKIDNKSNKKR